MLIGSTVKLVATFTDFDGVAANPTDVVVRFYDAMENQVGADALAVNVGAGEYEYDYEVEKDNRAYFEFSGMLDGLPVATRKKMVKKWID